MDARVAAPGRDELIAEIVDYYNHLTLAVLDEASPGGIAPPTADGLIIAATVAVLTVKGKAFFDSFAEPTVNPLRADES